MMLAGEELPAPAGVDPPDPANPTRWITALDATPTGDLWAAASPTFVDAVTGRRVDNGTSVVSVPADSLTGTQPTADPPALAQYRQEGYRLAVTADGAVALLLTDNPRSASSTPPSPGNRTKDWKLTVTIDAARTDSGTTADTENGGCPGSGS